MYGKYLKWQCLKCGQINENHLGISNLFSFDGGIRDYDYIETFCSQCGEAHLVTEARKINYISESDLANDLYYLAVVTREYAEQNNIEDRGIAFF